MIALEKSDSNDGQDKEVDRHFIVESYANVAEIIMFRKNDLVATAIVKRVIKLDQNSQNNSSSNNRLDAPFFLHLTRDSDNDILNRENRSGTVNFNPVLEDI